MNTPTHLTWGIKESLRSYVESLEDGSVEVKEPAVRNGDDFTFAVDLENSQFDAARNEGELAFLGSVSMVGHWGSMRIEIHDPRVSLTGNEGELFSLVKSVLFDDRYEPIATLQRGADDAPNTYRVFLTVAGIGIFGQQYQAGQELAPLTLS